MSSLRSNLKYNYFNSLFNFKRRILLLLSSHGSKNNLVVMEGQHYEEKQVSQYKRSQLS